MSNICAAMGRKLTRARRLHKLTLNDVAEELCISLHHLKALESGRLEELPGSVYALGFIRNYAELVELDAEGLIGMAKECLDADEAAKRPHLPEPHRESRFPTRLVLFGATSAMLLFFTAWPTMNSQVGSEASIVPMLPAHLAARLEDEAANDPKVTDPGKMKPSPGEELFLGQTVTPVAPFAAVPGEEDTDVAPEAAPRIEEEVMAEVPLEIRATKDTWVEIKNEKDQTLLSGVIRSGDSFVPDSTAYLKLTASDGGNLVLYVRGQLVSELGEPGRALRSVTLDVAGLLRDAS